MPTRRGSKYRGAAAASREQIKEQATALAGLTDQQLLEKQFEVYGDQKYRITKKTKAIVAARMARDIAAMEAEGVSPSAADVLPNMGDAAVRELARRSGLNPRAPIGELRRLLSEAIHYKRDGVEEPGMVKVIDPALRAKEGAPIGDALLRIGAAQETLGRRTQQCDAYSVLNPFVAKYAPDHGKEQAKACDAFRGGDGERQCISMESKEGDYPSRCEPVFEACLKSGKVSSRACQVVAKQLQSGTVESILSIDQSVENKKTYEGRDVEMHKAFQQAWMVQFREAGTVNTMHYAMLIAAIFLDEETLALLRKRMGSQEFDLRHLMFVSKVWNAVQTPLLKLCIAGPEQFRTRLAQLRVTMQYERLMKAVNDGHSTDVVTELYRVRDSTTLMPKWLKKAGYINSDGTVVEEKMDEIIAFLVGFSKLKEFLRL